MSVRPPYDEYDEIRGLVRVLGEARGAQAATPAEAVLFNAERFFFVTGFQPTMGDEYIERQGGFWLQQT